MCDTSGETEKPTIPRRNGMDFEPKKTNPPDYSNVPSVRDWQMSPFGNERYDLDEIQRAEKKGYKGRHELEAVKQRLAQYAKGECSPPPSPPPCRRCEERDEAEKRSAQLLRSNDTSTSEYVYQPFGPSVVSALSYSRPFTNPPKPYSYLGPSYCARFVNFQKEDPPPYCSSLNVVDRNFSNSYTPFGPYVEVRLTGDMYVPLGPSLTPYNKTVQ